jgi:hypothetical protein
MQHNTSTVITQVALAAFVFLLSVVSTAYAQNVVPPPPDAFYVRLMGTVVDAATNKPVPYAHVFHRSAKKLIVADSLGKFSAVISAKDTLQISSIGYYTLFYNKPPEQTKSYYAEIALRSQLYELETVNIITRRNRNLDNMLIRPEYKNKDKPKIWIFYNPEKDQSGPAEPTIMNPISLLYSKYNKREQSKRKLRDMIWETRYKEYIQKKYNAGLVERYTGLTGHYLEEFMRFCPMPDIFIIHASDYDIAERIFQCLEDYKEVKGWY